MSIHKLTAGSGYDYLTRQVAAQDVTEKGHTGLASYYAAKGEAPGQWVGSGMAGIDGLSAGDVVTAEQMQALFGSGHHPLAQQRRDRLQGPDLTDRDYQAVTRLGVPYKVYARDVSTFRLEVAQRIAELNISRGAVGSAAREGAVSVEDRARIRTEVAVEFFRTEHGRDPADAREIAATIAKHSRPRTTAVAGYDLTFSPVKSVSALWAVADPATAARIERAHHAAVQDALSFLEEHALYTRLGTNGVRQVNVQGLVATAFTHRDSRAGDPDLHTHVAMANKVQNIDPGGAGRWLSIDGRVLYKANVSASEQYNTSLEKHLRADLGLRFEERPNSDARKRAVREVVGVDARLTERWSARRASIQARRAVLAQQFQAAHGRPPTEVESIQLAQQATLETREAKHEARSLAEQRRAWHQQAVEVLGDEAAVGSMVQTATAPPIPATTRVDAAWIRETAERMVATTETRRSTWQVWHVRAEALRQARAADLAVSDVDRVVDLLVDEALSQHSVRLSPDGDGVAEPAQLRRRDDESVYTVHGAEHYTSARVLAAEQRLITTAARVDGRTVGIEAVDLALLETAANGVTLNAGQVALVRGMATSGARLQLAIAPAGAGKTTAMRALARAWENGGGTLIGLAPSAAAAAALRDQIDTNGAVRTDTLAKLTHHLANGDLPHWATQIGPDTLVVIDEAGMADTLSLDAAVDWITARGASVRLIGDDQQLAAIGAGGVLRDLDATHGALRLTELMRFADPAEGAASLALRDGLTDALGFYLDHHRVHVGDLATMTEDVFDAWQADRAAGLDAIMLAPTRDLVSDLNQRAREHRLQQTAGPTGAARSVRLADGNQASAGDLVITRANDRRLRISGSDWVKNGDRWTVLDVDPEATGSGSLTVQHTRSARVIELPADYVATSTELGFATTVHTAQGVSVDTVHGLATGNESRQQLYTMLTRGRLANHVYLEVVSDGDPHNAIRPDSIAPPTATDLLERVLARDDSPVSATTMARQAADPAVQLGQAATRYADALYVAAEDLLDRGTLEGLERAAETVAPRLTAEAAWPTLRAHLILLAATGPDPAQGLAQAADGRELDSAADRAAVLDWRLDDTGLRNAEPGPLPCIPAIPHRLAQHPVWGPYLRQRADLVTDLATQVRDDAQSAPTPAWAQQGAARPNPATLGDVAVWRAAMQVSDEDRRPTGPPQLQKAPARWQQRLNTAVVGDRTPALQEWGELLRRTAPAASRDDFTPLLAERLAAMSRAGLPTRQILAGALHHAPLPDDHAAAALWWRLSRHVAPAVAQEIDRGHTLHSDWAPDLATKIGPARVNQMQTSSWWPALVSTVDHALQRGWPLKDLMDVAVVDDSDVDPAQAMVWRLSVLTDPPPSAEDLDLSHPDDQAPPDMWDLDPDADVAVVHAPTPDQWDHEWAAADASRESGHHPPTPLVVFDVDQDPDLVGQAEPDADAQLQLAALERSVMGPLEPSDVDIELQVARAAEIDFAPVSAARMLEINQLTLAYYRDRYESSWAQTYLSARLGQDPASTPGLHPGYAPAGWTNLVTHLRRLGVNDEEMTEVGVATPARTGRLIDRFRDRAVMPIVHEGQVLGFVGRRNPTLGDDDNAGPKYLNTADTPLFHKGAQVFGLLPELNHGGATLVLVEGPLDAWAITLATGGSHVGISPLGTALTHEQATQIAHLGRRVIVANDADLPGRIAAERDYWLLTQHGLDPGAATFPDGLDPADVLADHGAHALQKALATARPLGELVLEERLTHLTGAAALKEAVQVLAARPPDHWTALIDTVAAQLRRSPSQARARLAASVQTWNRDPRAATQARLDEVSDVKARMSAAIPATPVDRWPALALEIDPRLSSQADWPALAAMMQLAHQDGHDVAATVRRLVENEPLSDLPAQDLRYRLVAALPLDIAAAPRSPMTDEPSRAARAQERRTPGTGTPRPPQTQRR
ncbi:MobF family relaxase [Phycicoccus sp. Root101]|uniref:MobF family relaxase n=1 Tax=Phycicoccus sp. Root101 TaxID=1736421 RepID=UPI0007030284|nr:MobF family relaxase [Phycicoccus sp. Root101]KQU67367.1 transfer protein Tra [Phycicoccus sp. Root101]